ncbi:MAG: YcxB family protein [Bacteroidetes bacterium]|nr:YcxB family protein [Bacteroidota bacterium]
MTYEFTHWGITRNGEKTEFSKPWRDVKKIKETKSFILFIFHNDFHVIQKRMLKNPDELNAFKEYIKENIKK